MFNFSLAATQLKYIDSADAEPGSFEGYGSAFNLQDWHGDIVLPGAFDRSLANYRSRRALPGMFIEHSAYRLGGDPLPVGVWTDIAPDQKGLHVKGRLLALDTNHGKRIRALMRDGAIRGLSIAYNVPEGGAIYGRKAGEPKRLLKAVELHSIEYRPCVV